VAQLPHTLNGSSGFGNRFIRIDQYSRPGIDFSNTPFDFYCPRFVNLSPGGRNESRKVMRETHPLLFAQPRRSSLGAFICDYHASDATSEMQVERA